MIRFFKNSVRFCWLLKNINHPIDESDRGGKFLIQQFRMNIIKKIRYTQNTFPLRSRFDGLTTRSARNT